MTTGAELAAWAFRSPRRLLVLAAVPVLVWAVVDLIGPDDNSRPESPAASSKVPSAQETRLDRADMTLEADPSPASLLPETQRVIDGFLSAWLDREQSPERWLSALVPYVTPELAEGMRSTDPMRVPDAGVAAVRPMQVGEYVAVVEIGLTTTGVEFEIEAVYDGQHWLVADVQSFAS